MKNLGLRKYLCNKYTWKTTDYLSMPDNTEGYLHSQFKNTPSLFYFTACWLNLCIFSSVSSHGASQSCELNICTVHRPKTGMVIVLTNSYSIRLSISVNDHVCDADEAAKTVQRYDVCFT